MSEDYFDAVEADIREAQREDPDVVLKWSWWKEQAERHGMTPNAVYTRAVKVGLYVPPDKRGNGESDLETEEISPFSSSVPDPKSKSTAPARDPSVFSPPPLASSSHANGRPASSPPAQGKLGDAIQGFASLVERASALEEQAGSLRRDLEQSQQENRRLRRALREMEELMERMRQVYRSATLPEE
jgi:hypothetical protein